MSLRSPHAQGQVTRATLCGNLEERYRTPSPPEAFCVEIYKKNAGPVVWARHFVRACAVETHTDISQEPFRLEIYRKNAAPASAHLD